MKQYKAVIYGASVKGIGIASQLPDQVLMVEKTSLAAREFADALVTGGGSWEADTEPGRQLAERCRRKGILAEGKPVQIAAAAPVMFEIIRDAGIPVLFGADIRVSSSEGKNIVTCFSDSGISQVCAEHIYDWEQEAAGQPGYGKYINALLYCENPPQATDWDNGIEGIKGMEGMEGNKGIRVLEYAHPDMKILCYPLNRDDDWVTARDKLHRFWKKRPAQLVPWKMVSAASSFAWLKETDENGGLLAPLYGNLLGAFESGVELGKKWREEK